MAWAVCPFCAATISEDSTVCSYCRKLLPPRLSKTARTHWIRNAVLAMTAVCVFMIVLVVIADRMAAPKGQPYVSPAEATFPDSHKSAPDTFLSLTAAEITAQYDANEIRANQSLKGVTMDITGPISDIGTDILGSPYVVLAEGQSAFGVQAIFPRDRTSDLASLSKGQAITVRCRMSGKMLNVIGRDCVLR